MPARSTDSYRGVLGIRDVRALIAASAASQLGDWLYNAALLGYVYSATGSPGWVGAAAIARVLPHALLRPLGGAVADRYDRRTVLLVGALLRCVQVFAVAAVVAFDGPVALVIALTALGSAAGTAERPAGMALLPRLVGEARIGPASALLHTVHDLGLVAGSALGAVLLAVTTATAAFVVNGLAFAISALLISTMRRQIMPIDVREGDGGVAHVVHGLRAARATPFVVPLLIVVAMVELTYGAQTVQLVVYAERVLDLGESGYGVLLAAAGVGGLLSAIVNGRLAASSRVSLIVVTAGAVVSATQLAYAGIDGLVLALAATVVGGAGVVACEVVAKTALARIVPAGVLGHVMGVFAGLSVTAMVAGAVVAPVLIASTSLDTSLVVLGAASLLVTVVCLTGLRGLDVVTRDRAEALASRVALIEQLPITSGVPQLVLEQLAAASQLCPIPPGVDVVVEGAPAHAFYAVVDGRVVVHREDAKIAVLGPSEHFGERGLLDNAPRNASVTTETASTILRLEGRVLLDALQSASSLLTALDRSNGAWRGGLVAAEPTALVDDATWRGA